MQNFGFHRSRNASPGVWMNDFGCNDCGFGLRNDENVNVNNWMPGFESDVSTVGNWNWRRRTQRAKRCFCCGATGHLIRDCPWMARSVEHVDSNAETWERANGARKRQKKLNLARNRNKKLSKIDSVNMIWDSESDGSVECNAKSLLSIGDGDNGHVDNGESLEVAKCVKAKGEAGAMDKTETDVATSVAVNDESEFDVAVAELLEVVQEFDLWDDAALKWLAEHSAVDAETEEMMGGVVPRCGQNKLHCGSQKIRKRSNNGGLH